MGFKPNDICIVDINNELNLKEYEECKVRIVKKVGWRKYLVTPVFPIVYPITQSSYILKQFVIDKKWLTKSSLEEKVVIRTPADCPAISKDDLRAIKIAIEVIEEEYENFTPYADILKSLSAKLNYYAQFNKKSEV